ncbi:hypothetical protein [Bradyrhizobium sp.]|uniref:hypothetical protein n=1 Tax=Bradyrhizobium sp. TaxID=376 RepID=UPI00272835DD|nr:hypothetical protein [Bradyrhizobium sp.]MDO9297979.1 hypothetical protein [Bradyrhizobium sp.]
MIVKAFKYKSGPKSAQRLNLHLWNEKDQRVELFETKNLYVPDSEAGMRVMRCLQQGSKNAEIVFWHIVISPITTLNAIDRARVVNLVVSEFRAETHPLMVWSHNEKPRARQGGGANHLHFVLGHICSVTLRALDMRNYLLRLQKIMAIAAYDIEGMTALTPFHRSIAAYLIKDGRGEVAAWLTDLAAAAPSRRHPRMTDAMRRSAAAVNFALPSFQAELERLWVTDASEEALTDFLSSAGVSARRGDRSPHAILLYRGDLLVGVMNSILRRPSFPVYEEAMLRFPGLFNKPRITVDAPRTSSRHSREAATLRQEKTERLGAVLRDVRRKVLHLTYPRAKPLHETLGAETERIAALKKFTRGIAILEKSIDLLWKDNHWLSAPIEALLEHSKRLVMYDKPSLAAKPSTQEKVQAPPGNEDLASAQDEDEMTVGQLLRP